MINEVPLVIQYTRIINIILYTYSKHNEIIYMSDLLVSTEITAKIMRTIIILSFYILLPNKQCGKWFMSSCHCSVIPMIIVSGFFCT